MSGTVTASPAAAFSFASFTDVEKADIRRFCGFPPYGAGAGGFQSWRFFQLYGLLEFRMNNLAPAECQNVRYYLSLLYPLESAIPAAGGNLDTDQAAVWKRNANEVGDREALLSRMRRGLCALVGVPPGPNLRASGSTIALVV